MAQIDANSLRRLKNLSSFDPQQLQKLSVHLVLATFNKNETIFDQDSEAQLVYLLLSGGVRASYLARDRRPITVGLVSKGDFFGLDALVPKARHAFRCDALEKSVVGNIEPRVFIETVLGTSFEAFARWYIPIMLPGQQAYIHCVKGLGLDVRRRVALELLNLADRFGIADARATDSRSYKPRNFSWAGWRFATACHPAIESIRARADYFTRGTPDYHQHG